jgi:hypothetical protein
MISSNVMLSPLGVFNHEKGTELVTTVVASGLIDEYNSLGDKIRRRFGGVPVYKGHPDDPEFHGCSGHDDSTVIGYAVSLYFNLIGLYAAVNWTTRGVSVLSATGYRYASPRWLMKSIGSRAWIPVRLISIGITDSPNLSVRPFEFFNEAKNIVELGHEIKK